MIHFVHISQTSVPPSAPWPESSTPPNGASGKGRPQVVDGRHAFAQNARGGVRNLADDHLLSNAPAPEVDEAALDIDVQ